jgi:hypothetical protein
MSEQCFAWLANLFTGANVELGFKLHRGLLTLAPANARVARVVGQ